MVARVHRRALKRRVGHFPEVGRRLTRASHRARDVAPQIGRETWREIWRAIRRAIGRETGREIGREIGRETGRGALRKIERHFGRRRKIQRNLGRKRGREEAREVGRKVGSEIARTFSWWLFDVRNKSMYSKAALTARLRTGCIEQNCSASPAVWTCCSNDSPFLNFRGMCHWPSPFRNHWQIGNR
eukprot:2116469-Pleurochrysis_carterae.AAC.1